MHSVVRPKLTNVLQLWWPTSIVPSCNVLSSFQCLAHGKSYTVFAKIFVIVLISDVTFIMKFKKLNNWRCTAQHAGLASSSEIKTTLKFEK